MKKAFLLCLLLPLTSSCGDGSGAGGGSAVTLPPGGGSAAPAPSPTPTPSPTATPPPYVPIVAVLFADPLLTPALVVAGKGWQFDYDRNPPYASSNIENADGFSVIYDSVAGGYRVTLPEFGTGLLQQISADFDAGAEGMVFAARLQGSSSTTSGGMNLRRPNTGRPALKYATWVNWYAERPLSGSSGRVVMGVTGLAQPTPAGAIPLTGTARFDGSINAYMAGNGADMLVGTAEIQIDRGTGWIDGRLTMSIQCMMGCSYPAVEYRLHSPIYSAGGQTFSAGLVTGATTEIGRLTASFAGPDAKELLIQIELPFYDPNFKVWTKAGGVVLARTD